MRAGGRSLVLGTLAAQGRGSESDHIVHISDPNELCIKGRKSCLC